MHILWLGNSEVCALLQCRDTLHCIIICRYRALQNNICIQSGVTCKQSLGEAIQVVCCSSHLHGALKVATVGALIFAGFAD